MSLTRGLLPKFLIASICKLLALGHMRFIFSFICVCLCALVHAQVVDISAPAKLPAKTGKFRIVGKNNDGIMVRLYGGDDVLNGFGGADRLFGDDGNDFILGNTGSDTMEGGSGNDEVQGGSGNDHIMGES